MAQEGDKGRALGSFHTKILNLEDSPRHIAPSRLRNHSEGIRMCILIDPKTPLVGQIVPRSGIIARSPTFIRNRNT
jgi:hypothetical protein